MPLAATYSSYGESRVLSVEPQPVPEVRPGALRVRVAYSSVNPVDVKMRAGLLSGGVALTAPAVAGMDLAGTVDAVGAGVDEFRVGDRVAGMAPSGAAAEYVVTDPTMLVKVPDAVSLLVASTIGVAGTTALRALDEVGVQAGNLILVDGAAGGVGTFLTQLAVDRGARVVGTASPRNHGRLRSMGVTPIDYAPGWEDAARAAAEGATFDAAFDLVTGGKHSAFRTLVGPGGDIVTLVDPAVPRAGGILITGMEPGYEFALDDVMAAVAGGHVRVPIHAVYALTDIAAAQDLVAGGHVQGKVVLRIAGDDAGDRMPATA